MAPIMHLISEHMKMKGVVVVFHGGFILILCARFSYRANRTPVNLLVMFGAIPIGGASIHQKLWLSCL